jgi:hypothetical protein
VRHSPALALHVFTVAFSQSSFVVTIANGKIYVVKKK